MHEPVQKPALAITTRPQISQRPRYIESFECERKSLNCEEAMVNNRYNLTTDVCAEDIDSSDEIILESEDNDCAAVEPFEHAAFENLYDAEGLAYLISQEEAYSTGRTE